MPDSTEPTTQPTTPADSPVEAPPVVPEPVATEAPPKPSADPAKQLEHWKAMARKNEQRAKDNADKARRFDELEESSKSELQKALDRAERAEATAKAAETDRLRHQVAAEKSVPASLLSGTTPEELAASADALLEFKGAQAPPDFGAGRRGEAPKPIEALDQQIAEAIKAGNAPRSIALKQQRQALLNIPK